MGGDEEREGNEMRAEGGDPTSHIAAAVSLPAELMGAWTALPIIRPPPPGTS
jgi:hypothetical protein